MSEIEQLSEREIEILRLLAGGASNKDIARDLVISINTVKVHLKNIYAKLEVASRTEATLLAVRAGLVDPHQDAESLLEPFGGEAPPTLVLPSEPAALSPGKALPAWAWAVGAILIFLLISLIAWAFWPKPETPAELLAAPLDQAGEAIRWQQRASLSSPRARFAVTVYDNHLYAIAGETRSGASDLVEVYDPAQDQWSTLAAKPQAVMDVSAAAIGGEIYVPGGRLESGQVSDALEVYLPRTNQWQTRQPLPAGRSAYALAAYEGKLYLFGGWDGQQYVNTVFEYDPSADRWQAVAPLPTARGFASAIILGGRIHVMGGVDGRQSLTAHESFLPGDPAESWIRELPLPQGRYGMGAANLAETIYLIGGLDGETSSQSSFQYMPFMQEWLRIENLLAQTWAYMGLVPVGANLYVLGGELSGEPTDQFWSYQAIYTIAIPVIQQ